MLKGIPKILSPELLKILCEMGHGDRIIIADGNFPAESLGRDIEVIRMDGHSTCALLDAILQVFPLDTYVDTPVLMMEVLKGDNVETPIWNDYIQIITNYDNRGEAVISHIDRYEFYEQSRNVYAIIATGESALYANIMLQKGIV